MFKSKRVISIIVYIVFLVVIFLLPFFSFKGYSIISNTTSHLAAQSSPFAWIMDIVFISLGLISIIINYQTRIVYYQVVGGVFGFSLIMTAFFPHAPLISNVSINFFFDQIHSIFANLTGFSFTMLAVGHAIMSEKNQRICGVIIAIIAMLFSIGMMILPSLMGILQRILFISTFGWLFFYMKPPIEYQHPTKQ